MYQVGQFTGLAAQHVPDGGLGGVAVERRRRKPYDAIHSSLKIFDRLPASAVGQQHHDDGVGITLGHPSAATTAMPHEPPTSRPSSRARRRVISKESASETAMISSGTDGS